MGKINLKDVEHDCGEMVYLKSDPDQIPRVVVGYELRDNRIRYILRQETTECVHQDIEISKKEDVILKTSR